MYSEDNLFGAHVSAAAAVLVHSVSDILTERKWEAKTMNSPENLQWGTY